MTNLVLIHRADSIYDDVPEAVYDFPQSYLKAVEEAVGEWIIYYEPVKSGPRGYYATACISDVVEKPDAPGRFLALMQPGTYLEFIRDVPRLLSGRPIEAALADENGLPKKGGAVQLSVRRLPKAEYAKIVELGLPANLEMIEENRYQPDQYAFHELQVPFERPIVERLTRRKYRDVAFRRKVREAYDYRCAFSGLRLRNGGGRPEVQAAHIRPVEHNGSDSVRNGLALSGTLHWMFDRGLVSVAEDHSILISRNKVPPEVVDRLFTPGLQLRLPRDERYWPHPAYLRWHRENRFGQFDPDTDLAEW